MVCPICRGKSEVGVFCGDCYLKQNLKVEVPSVIEVQWCKRCSSFLLGGRWVRGINEEEAMLRVAEDSIKTNMKRLERSGVIRLEVEKNEIEYRLTVVITIGNEEKRKHGIIRLRNIVCPHCSRAAGGYFEAILQLRGNVDEKELEKIASMIEGHKDRYSFIGDIKRMHGGYDLYIGSKKSAEKIVKEFRGKAETKKSRQLVGYDERAGKPQYRFAYLLRF